MRDTETATCGDDQPRLQIESGALGELRDAEMVPDDAIVVSQADVQTAVPVDDDVQAVRVRADELETALEMLRSRRAAAEESASALSTARDEHERRERRRQAAEDRIVEARRGIRALEAATLSETEVRRRLECAHSRADELAGRHTDAVRHIELEHERRDAVASGADARRRELQELRREITELDEPTPDAPEGLARALDRYRASISASSDPDAARLADDWANEHPRLAHLLAVTPPPVSDRALRAVADAVSDAEAALAAVQDSATPLAPETRAQLDAAHDSVETALSAHRRGQRGSNDRLRDARLCEHQLLGRYGFSSHDHFLLAAGSGDPERQLKLWSAEKHLGDAQGEHERLLRTREPHPELARLRASAAARRKQASALLGFDIGEESDADLEQILRQTPTAARTATDELAGELRERGSTPISETLMAGATRLLDDVRARQEAWDRRIDEIATINDELDTAAEAEPANLAASDGRLDAVRQSAHEISRERNDALGEVEALEDSLRDRVERTPDAPAAHEARRELAATIDRLEAAMSDDRDRSDEARRAAEDCHAERVAECGAARADVDELARDAGLDRQSSPTAILARLRRDLAKTIEIDLSAVVSHVEGLRALNPDSTLVLDHPMTPEGHMDVADLERLAELGVRAPIVWLTARPEALAWSPRTGTATTDARPDRHGSASDMHEDQGELGCGTD